jgi:hypothetical protein
MSEGLVDLEEFAKRAPRRGRRRRAEQQDPGPQASGEQPDGGGPGHRERTVIILAEQETNKNLRKVQRVIRGDIVMRGPVPMAMVRVDDPAGMLVAGVRHPQGLPILVNLTPGLVQFRVDERVLFKKYDGRKDELVPKSCPPSFAAKLIEAAADLGFDQIVGIITAPIFAAGKVTAKQGFDRRAGLYQAYAGRLPDIPKRPSKADAEAALTVALRPFGGYLEGDNLSKDERAHLRATVSAAVLTAALRASLARAPVILLDANCPGAGKGLAAKALAIIATGCLPSLITEGADPAELEKRLAAAVLSGAGAMVLDNLSRQLRSSTLESIVTEGYATIRNFGTLGSITVPMTALILMTANNLTLRHDMLRRTLTVRLIVKTDTPERRRFDFDPFKRAIEERDAILAACFTIARAWWLARDLPENRPIRAKSLGSFEEWSDLVGGAVQWLTGLHPADLIESRKTADTGRGAELRAVSALVEWQNGAWKSQNPALNSPNGTNPWRAKDALEGTDGDVWAEVLRVKRGDTPSPRELGDFLRYRRDQVFTVPVELDKDLTVAWVLTGNQDRKGVMRWKFVTVDESTLPPGQPGHAGSSIWDGENCQNRTDTKNDMFHRWTENDPARPGVTRQGPDFEVDL